MFHSFIRLSSNGFLNDSFIESPAIDKSKQINDNNTNTASVKSDFNFNPSSLPTILEKRESSGENSANRNSTSRKLKYDEPSEQILEKKELDRPKISLFSKIQSNDTTKKLSETVTTRVSDASWNSKSKSTEAKNLDRLNGPADAVKRPGAVHSKPNESITLEQKLCTELQTPKVKVSPNDAHLKPVCDEETPYKTFQVPPTASMHRAQTTSNHRSILSSASQSRKCRSDLENEFKSQKVLFTTPSAVSRPAMKAINHLGLDDSLNCYKSSHMAHLSAIKDERKAEVSHSSGDLIASDQQSSTHKMNDINADDVASTKNSIPETNTSDDKKKVITINGKDFEIQRRIGQGGSSSVFLVEHKDTKIQCALKVRCLF